MNKDSSQHDELNDSAFFFFDHRVECRDTFSGTCQDLKLKINWRSARHTIMKMA